MVLLSYLWDVIKAYKYRLSPTPKQQEFFEKSFGCCRYIYNWALNERITAYQQDKTKLSAVDLCKRLTHLKKEPELSWLTEPTNECLQQSIRNMDSAFTRFFREKKGFPKFKAKHRSRPSAKFINGVLFDFEKSRVKVPKIGWVKFYCDRTFEGKIGTLTVTRIPTGKYFASIVVDCGNPVPEKAPINPDTTVGIDVGLKSFAVLSNGEMIGNPKHLEKGQKRLAVLQRRLAKKQKGSNRRERARLAVAKCYERIANRRSDFLHQITSKIIAENQGSIVIEDLNVEGMLKNHCLAKSISSVAWGEFFRQLEYKSEWNGRNLIRIGRFEPSSRMCTCGKVNKELTLKDREWTCSGCGATHDRDLLAANNIKRFGLKNQNLIGQTPAVSGEEGVELLALAGTEKRQYLSVNYPCK